VTVQAERDLLQALFELDFARFAQRSVALDPADGRCGRLIDAAFRLAVRWHFDDAVPFMTVAHFVADALGQMGEGKQDLNLPLAERLVNAALRGRTLAGLDRQEVLQVQILLIYRIVVDGHLSYDEQHALLADAEALMVV